MCHKIIFKHKLDQRSKLRKLTAVLKALLQKRVIKKQVSGTGGGFSYRMWYGVFTGKGVVNSSRGEFNEILESLSFQFEALLVNFLNKWCRAAGSRKAKVQGKYCNIQSPGTDWYWHLPAVSYFFFLETGIFAEHFQRAGILWMSKDC